MNNSAQKPLAEQLAAAQDWWRAAGVDYDFADTPTAWLAEAEKAEGPPPPPVVKEEATLAPDPVKPLVEPSDLPESLNAFETWWLAPESPIPGATATRVAPRGHEGAKLMVLVPSPEQDDRERLLSGRQGTLVRNILRALGVTENEAYLASALPSAIAEPDWLELHKQGLGSVVAHHIALVKPARLVLFGRGLPLLLEHAQDASPEAFSNVDSPAGKLPVLTTFAPDRLLGHARQRARLWRRLLNWME